ncbi:MAG: hypothetical protein LUQ26_00640 [Methylococcaceae bacterium]|nr:hypothetical protein [Methylococcaceae bacterium]
MADSADQADEINDAMVRARLKTAENVTANLKIYVNETGFCWECSAPVPDKRRWCSPECRKAAEEKL